MRMSVLSSDVCSSVREYVVVGKHGDRPGLPVPHQPTRRAGGNRRMADADTAARRAFAGRVTEGVKARLLDIGDELHRAVVRLVVWHPKNLGDALCQRQVAQRSEEHTSALP